MFVVEHIRRLPANIQEFIDEIAAELANMYGPDAATHYRRIAPGQLQAALQQPSVVTLACRESEDIVGVLFAVQRGLVTQFSLLHVLSRVLGRGVEERLISEAVRLHRNGGAEAILCEYVSFNGMDDVRAYQSLGFETIKRELMTADISEPGLATESDPVTTPFDESGWPDAAEVIVEAYKDHPGRRLHVEVRDIENARMFVQAAAEGSYGRSRSGYLRWIREGGRSNAVILGCEIAPANGFILQVAVRPDLQHQGLGTKLVREQAQTFAAAGCRHVVLGVTSDSPAHRLYQRLGFRLLRPVTAHVWWRP